MRAAFGRLVPEGRIGLAVSGGPDSLALLILADAAVPGRIAVATVDHGLRPEAAQECVLVEAACTTRGIACETLSVTVAPGNLQQEARRARYAALGEWAVRAGLSALATAHHADDQAETLLMRLNRGSGLGGLAGIRPKAMLPECAVPVIRPLLDMRRSELAGVVAEAGLAPVNDPSNVDQRFDRVRVRQALANADWLDPAGLARSAQILGDAEETLAAMADAAWQQNAEVAEGAITVSVSQWREITLRLLERALANFGAAPARSEIANLIDRLAEDGAKANLAGVLVTRRGDRFECRPEPPRRPARK